MKLYIGKKFTGISVEPDDRWPGMYRVHWPDQPPSVMVNLARAKDAAMRWVGRDGGQQGRGLTWKAYGKARGGVAHALKVCDATVPTR